MRRLGWTGGIAMYTLSLLASTVQAQVDWSDVLSGKAAQPVVEDPNQPEAPPPPAPPPVQHRPGTRAGTRESARAAAPRAARPGTHRAVGMPEPEDEPEYPSVPIGRRR